MTTTTPVPKGTHLKLAIALYHQGRYERMEEQIRKELAADPDDAETLSWLGLALFKQWRKAEALAVLADATRLQPDLGFAHHIRAAVLFDEGRMDRMVFSLIAVDGEPARKGANHQEKSEEALREAMRLDPENPHLYDLLSQIRLEQGRTPEALEAAEHGLSIEPGNPTLLRQRAAILARLGRKEEAREASQAALAAEPESAAAHKEYGELLYELHAPGQAAEHLREALRLNPNLEEDIRPTLAQALREKMRLYRWLTAGGNTTLFLYGMLTLFVLGSIWVYQSDWRPFEIVSFLLPGSFTLPMIMLSLISALDPLFNLVMGRTLSGRMMLSEDERRTSLRVGACLLISIAAAVAWPILGGDRFLLASVFAFAWIIPLTTATQLTWDWQRRIGWGCLAVAIVLTIVPFLVMSIADTQDSLNRVWPYCLAGFGLMYAAVFTAFAFGLSAGEYRFFMSSSRQRALVIFWSVQLIALLIGLAGEFGRRLLPVEAKPTARYVGLAGSVLFAMTLFSPTAIIDRLHKVMKRS